MRGEKDLNKYSIHNCFEMNSDDDAAKRPFKCEICGKSFVQKSTCVTHQLRHFREYIFIHSTKLTFLFLADEESKLPFSCDKCDKRFRLMESLDQHNKFHLR